MGYTSTYIYRDGMGSGSGMGSRGSNPISFKRYGFERVVTYLSFMLY